MSDEEKEIEYLTLNHEDFNGDFNEDFNEKVNTKILRVVFRTFLSDELISRIKSNKKKFLINLTSFLTIPKGYKGLKYDHVEIITPQNTRFSITIDGRVVYNKKIMDLRLPGVSMLNDRYKLVFGFPISEHEEDLLNEFITTNLNKPYNLIKANYNFLIRKYIGEVDYIMNNNESSWDCVSLCMKCLKFIKILKVNSNLLGYSSFDFAHLLINLVRRGQINPSIIICKDLCISNSELAQYYIQIYLFYKFGSVASSSVNEIEKHEKIILNLSEEDILHLGNSGNLESYISSKIDNDSDSNSNSDNIIYQEEEEEEEKEKLKLKQNLIAL